MKSIRVEHLHNNLYLRAEGGLVANCGFTRANFIWYIDVQNHKINKTDHQSKLYESMILIKMTPELNYGLPFRSVRIANLQKINDFTFFFILVHYIYIFQTFMFEMDW